MNMSVIMKRAMIVMMMIMITKNEMEEHGKGEEIGIGLIESELPLNSDLVPVVDS